MIQLIVSDICIIMTNSLLFKQEFKKNTLKSSVIELVILANTLKSTFIEQNLS